MRTFSFVTIENNDDCCDLRTVIITGDLARKCHFSRFLASHPHYRIVDIHQTDQPDFKSAFDWVRECIPIYRQKWVY